MKRAIINYNRMNDKVTISEFERLTNLCKNCLKENPNVLESLNALYESISINFLYETQDKEITYITNLKPTPAISKSRNKIGSILVFIKHLEQMTAKRTDITDIQAYQKNGLFEEFCHLVDQNGDCSVHPEAYGELWNLYKSRGYDWLNAGNEIIAHLDQDRNHYTVFYMLLKAIGNNQ